MIKTYAYKGDEIIGEYITRVLNEKGYSKVADVASADIIFVHCYHAGAIEDVYFDDDGLIKEATPETYLVNLSPSTPSLAREVSAVAAVNDLRCIEAPLALVDPFVPDMFSDASNLMMYLGGETEDCEAVRDCLAQLVGNVVASGDCGAAQLAKVCHTIRQASTVIATVEEFALCHDTQHNLAARKVEGFPVFEVDPSLAKLEKYIAADSFSSGYSNTFLISDVVAAMSTADDAGLILPQLESAMHILELFGVIGGADLGIAALALLYSDESVGEAAGLDWTRAENFYRNLDHEHGETYDDDDDFDFGDNIDYFSN